jgi:hypothetical protein
MRIIIAVVVILVLSGCAMYPTSVWHMDGSTPQMFEQDNGACEMEALKAIASCAQCDGIMMAGLKHSVYESCMRSKGWTKTGERW